MSNTLEFKTIVNENTEGIVARNFIDGFTGDKSVVVIVHHEGNTHCISNAESLELVGLLTIAVQGAVEGSTLPSERTTLEE